MSERGAQPGNQNAVKKPWAQAIEMALEARGQRAGKSRREILAELGETFLTKCDAGDLAAFKELGDRLDGKAPQAITGADGGDLRVLFTAADSGVL